MVPIKIPRIYQFALVVLVALASVPVLGLSDPSGWVSLFNGTDLSGWTVISRPEVSVVGGLLHFEKGKGWLRSEREYKNFILEAEWRGGEPNYNSGFFLRAGSQGEPYPTGAWQVNLKATDLGSLIRGNQLVLPSKTAPIPPGQWCKFRMEARDRHLELYVNDSKAWAFEDLEPASGFIGLQVEGKSIDFRNIRVQELP